MKAITCCGVATATMLLSGTALAQENIFRAVPGAKQLGISGGWASVGGQAKYAVTFEGGYYVTDRLVAISRFGIVKRSPQNLGFLFGARYEFPGKSSSVPYIVAAAEFHRGAHDGQPSDMIFPDPSDPNATFIQGGVGVNHFLNTRTAVFLEFIAFKKSGDNRIGTNAEIGLRIYFK